MDILTIMLRFLKTRNRHFLEFLGDIIVPSLDSFGGHLRPTVSKCTSFCAPRKTLCPTFLAITRPVVLWRTFITTPPFPAPSSPILSNTSAVSSPTVCFCVRKCSSLCLCWSSMSSSFSFCVRDSMLGLGLLKNRKGRFIATRKRTKGQKRTAKA